uniref:CN hydrolase domain-containing protein n=1 Tax=Leptobrachium leishanense TaxID=445787 RepID=A0A8C5N0Q2_9ANUR
MLASFWCSVKKFIAAVYEHNVILPEETATPVTKQEALDLMNRNIDILENAIKRAAQKGAHIIVTPEDGIYGWRFTRETINPYLEDIPDPKVNWIPCNDPKRYGINPVQTRLSCLAKQNSIYVVANIGDKKYCNTSEAGCPKDGQYNYNTAVVYDSEGKLIARYHKQHLFLGETQFNAPHEAEIVSFDTPFGRFGIFICFDVLFHDPAVALVVDHNVDTILFPTAWMNVLPHLSAIEFHSAWAMGMGVNFLSSNTHLTTRRMTGSGVFSPENIGPYYYNMDSEDGHLVISELIAHPRNTSTYYGIKWNQYASTIKKFPSGTNVFKGNVFFDEFTFTELKEPQGSYTICQNDLCCHLSYKKARNDAHKIHKNEIYVIGAFDGLHVVEGQYHLQVCTLLKCLSSDLQTCGESVDTASTKFESFSLSGNFSTNFVFPEVLLDKVNLAPNMFKVNTCIMLIICFYEVRLFCSCDCIK